MRSARTAAVSSPRSSFSPHYRLGGVCSVYLRDYYSQRGGAHLQKVGGGPPAERKRLTYQLPVAPYGRVAPRLVLAPSQSVLDLLVALLNLHPKPVRPNHLRGVNRRQCALFPLPPGAEMRQVGE